MFSKFFRAFCLVAFSLSIFLIPVFSHQVEPDPGLTGAIGSVTYDFWLGDGEWWEKYIMYDSTQDSNNNTASTATVHLTKHAKTGILGRVKGSSYAHASSRSMLSLRI